MSTSTTVSPYSDDVTEKLKTLYRRLNNWAMMVDRIWNRLFTDTDRAHFGDNLNAAYHRHGGTIGMWMELRGVSLPLALVQVGRGIGSVSPSTAEWLLREIGETNNDTQAVVETAVHAGGLVLRERPREAYWNRNLISIDWDAHTALWEFLWELALRAKKAMPLDCMDLGASTTAQALADRKSRLTSNVNFPVDLGDRMESAGRGTYRLQIEFPMIRIFRIDSHEVASEIGG